MGDHEQLQQLGGAQPLGLQSPSLKAGGALQPFGLQSPINAFGKPCMSAANSPSLKAFWENLSPLQNNHSLSPTHENLQSLQSARLLFTNFEETGYLQAEGVKDEPVGMGSLLGDGSDDIPRSPNLKRKGTAFKNSADAHNMNKRKKDHDSSKSEVLTMPMGGGGQQLQQDTGAAGGGLGGHQHAHDTQTQARVLRSTPSSLKKVQTKEVCTAIERKNMQKDSKNLQKGKKRAFTSADGDTHMLQTPPTIPYGHVSPHTLPKNGARPRPSLSAAFCSSHNQPSSFFLFRLILTMCVALPSYFSPRSNQL
jgi:hypothetical protein